MQCKSILIVEDEKAIREALQMALELEGYQVYGVANGKEGLDALPHIPSPCLILVDLMMPVMNGWEFVEALEHNMVLATIPIVIVSAYTDKAKAIKAKNVIKKPVDLDLLLKVVKQYCS